MKPIEFQCQIVMRKSAIDICNEILNVESWSDFNGYGFLPGIEKAEYRKQTDNVLGSVIQVYNSDGSKHIEEIIKWKNGGTISMKMHEFSSPVNKIATHFIENWTFTKEKNKTLLIRQFILYPKTIFTKPFLWLISKILKKAIQQHLITMSI